MIISSQTPKTNAAPLLRDRLKTDIIPKVHTTYGLVVKGLSRLPVTEKIAGSNPVEPAKQLFQKTLGSFYHFRLTHYYHGSIIPLLNDLGDLHEQRNRN